MNNEILEISQWLHEKGFQPDIAVITQINCRESTWEDYGYVDWYKGCEMEPHFTLHRALELLRDHDRLEKYPNIHKEFLSILVQDDMHLAALKLLVQVIKKEGYLNEKS